MLFSPHEFSACILTRRDSCDTCVRWSLLTDLGDVFLTEPFTGRFQVPAASQQRKDRQARTNRIKQVTTLSPAHMSQLDVTTGEGRQRYPACSCILYYASFLTTGGPLSWRAVLPKTDAPCRRFCLQTATWSGRLEERELQGVDDAGIQHPEPNELMPVILPGTPRPYFFPPLDTASFGNGDRHTRGASPRHGLLLSSGRQPAAESALSHLAAMKKSAAALLGAIHAVSTGPTDLAPGKIPRDVDTAYPYTGPEVPVGDWVDPSVNGVPGKGFPRLTEAPAVAPATSAPTNNINVISLSYIPNGINVHFQTPFGLDEEPRLFWGRSPGNLTCLATGTSST